MAAVHHECVHFSGHVQGVGFRYAVMQIARGFEVTGFVRNLADGRVHLEVEGRAGEIKAFVEAIGERMHGYIRKVERTESEREPQYAGFRIEQ